MKVIYFHLRHVNKGNLGACTILFQFKGSVAEKRCNGAGECPLLFLCTALFDRMNHLFQYVQIFHDCMYMLFNDMALSNYKR